MTQTQRRDLHRIHSTVTAQKLEKAEIPSWLVLHMSMGRGRALHSAPARDQDVTTLYLLLLQGPSPEQLQQLRDVGQRIPPFSQGCQTSPDTFRISPPNGFHASCEFLKLKEASSRITLRSQPGMGSHHPALGSCIADTVARPGDTGWRCLMDAPTPTL